MQDKAVCKINRCLENTGYFSEFYTYLSKQHGDVCQKACLFSFYLNFMHLC